MLDQVPVAATADRLINMQLDSALLNQHSRGRKVEPPKVPTAARDEDEELRAWEAEQDRLRAENLAAQQPRTFDSHLSTSERLARATGQDIQCSDIQVRIFRSGYSAIFSATIFSAGYSVFYSE